MNLQRLNTLFTHATASEKAEETLTFLNKLKLFRGIDDLDKKDLEEEIFQHLMKINLKLLER